jgi:hypothetical protein
MILAGCVSSESNFEEAHPWMNEPFVEAQLDDLPEPVRNRVERSKSEVRRVEFFRTDDGSRVFRLIRDSGSFDHYDENGQWLGGVI